MHPDNCYDGAHTDFSLGRYVCRNCPLNQNQLFKYTSPSTGITCWVVLNFNAPIEVNLQCAE